MSFTLPTFNLTVNIWRTAGVGGAYAAPDVVAACNLSLGLRAEIGAVGLVPTTPLRAVMQLLLPPLTDIRSSFNGQQPDLVECPAGSLRFYNVTWTDDVGKGFANEHRIAFLSYLLLGGTVFGFAAPVPLP